VGVRVGVGRFLGVRVGVVGRIVGVRVGVDGLWVLEWAWHPCSAQEAQKSG